MPVVALLAALAALPVATTPARPDGLPAPTNALVSVVAHGEGVQTYTCRGGVWAQGAPEAVLTNVRGERIGSHFAGPSWRANDGGVVIGRVVARTPSPSGQGVDWLLLRAVSSPTRGLFAHVVYVVRQKTTGGRAPSGACDAARSGVQMRAPYSAEYDFYTPGS